MQGEIRKASCAGTLLRDSLAPIGTTVASLPLPSPAGIVFFAVSWDGPLLAQSCRVCCPDTPQFQQAARAGVARPRAGGGSQLSAEWWKQRATCALSLAVRLSLAPAGSPASGGREMRPPGVRGGGIPCRNWRASRPVRLLLMLSCCDDGGGGGSGYHPPRSHPDPTAIEQPSNFAVNLGPRPTADVDVAFTA